MFNQNNLRTVNFKGIVMIVSCSLIPASYRVLPRHPKSCTEKITGIKLERMKSGVKILQYMIAEWDILT